MSVLSKEFLDIQATTECGLTLKCVCDIIRTHSLIVILPIFFSAFSCIHLMLTFFSRERHLYRAHKNLYPAHHLEWADNKQFSGFIGSRYIIKNETVVWWVARFSLAFCHLAKAFKHNTIYLVFIFLRPSKQQQQ